MIRLDEIKKIPSNIREHSIFKQIILYLSLLVLVLIFLASLAFCLIFVWAIIKSLIDGTFRMPSFDPNQDWDLR